MRTLLRASLLLSVFVGVGLLTARVVATHAASAGSEVRLAAAMAGLFAGGAAALLAGIGLALARRR